MAESASSLISLWISSSRSDVDLLQLAKVDDEDNGLCGLCGESSEGIVRGWKGAIVLDFSCFADMEVNIAYSCRKHV